MSELIRVSGKTLEDAITNATIRLGVTSDKIVYTVIEHESKGFLGIGQKDAVIEVRAKDEADFEAERLSRNVLDGQKNESEEKTAGRDSEEIQNDSAMTKPEAQKEEEIKEVSEEEKTQSPGTGRSGE